MVEHKIQYVPFQYRELPWNLHMSDGRERTFCFVCQAVRMHAESKISMRKRQACCEEPPTSEPKTVDSPRKTVMLQAEQPSAEPKTDDSPWKNSRLKERWGSSSACRRTKGQAPQPTSPTPPPCYANQRSVASQHSQENLCTTSTSFAVWDSMPQPSTIVHHNQSRRRQLSAREHAVYHIKSRLRQQATIKEKIVPKEMPSQAASQAVPDSKLRTSAENAGSKVRSAASVRFQR